MARLSALCAALLLLAGTVCAGPDGDDARDGGPTSTRDTGSTGTRLPEGARAVVNGTLRPLGAGFYVNVSAYNPGPETYGIAVGYSCVDSGYGAWTASLAGPSGEDLDYQGPYTTRYSCSGMTGHPMPPGTYVNWTFSGDRTNGTCTVADVCGNWWDGNLTTDDGRVRAPAGIYTWRFTFTYSAGSSGGAESLEQEAIEFEVPIPDDG